MKTITTLQIFCFILGLIFGYSYSQGFYGIAALAGVAAGTALGVLFAAVKGEGKDAG